MDESCAACHKNVGNDFLRAMSRLFHPDCLVCKKCKTSLKDSTFVPKDKDPYCKKCYEENFGRKCSQCEKVIGADEDGTVTSVEALGRHWHEKCWYCTECRVLFNEGGQKRSVYTVDGMPYCEEHARLRTSNKAESPSKPTHLVKSGDRVLCEGCHSEIKDVFVNALGHKYHKHCFVCSICKVSIADTRFYENKGNVFCENCDNKGFAKLCRRCNKNITPDANGHTTAVKAGGNTYHVDCYTCEYDGCGVHFNSSEGVSAYPVNQKLYCRHHAEEMSKLKQSSK